ncbi:MAG: MBOAT family O-acyltransferase [bacterium]|nr:MBOAT family O-acyltransferase [bacterium]
MLFNSFSFLIFFPVVVALYYLLPHRFRWGLLLVASSYFYMAFVPYYILILFYLIIIDFFAAKAIEQAQGRKRKLFLIISIIANIGTLFFFKYFNFFNASIEHLSNLLDWNYSIPALAIILPLGLSFHVFQSLSYVIEVYYKRYPAEHHFGIYALYVMFFPQLVAGPIERPAQLLPQLHAKHTFDANSISAGIKIMLWGFFKKVVIADTIGVVVDTIYGNPDGANGITAAMAAIAFAIQLYADFSGYSDIARGSARVLGINLMKNFDVPYFSRSISDFWRRWHISLSNWFRDYLYIPLGGSYGSKLRTCINVMIVFIICGLWHGAGWTFIFFGAIFGLYNVIGFITKKARIWIAGALGLLRLPRLYAAIQTLITFALVSIGFIFFRAPSLTDALFFIKQLFFGWTALFEKQFWISTLLNPRVSVGLTKAQLLYLAIACLIMLGGEYLDREKHLTARLAKSPGWLRWGAYYALIATILIFGYYKQRTFIYYQF